MNPFKLIGVAPNGKQCHVWGCGVCMRAALHEETAERCCKCNYCGQQIVDRECWQTDHKECRDAHSAKKAMERMEKAEKLEEWDGGVFWNNEYFDSIRDAEQAIWENSEEGDEWPEYLYVAKPMPRREVDPYWVYERLLDDNDPENEIELNGMKEFEAACKAFDDANKWLIFYDEDTKRAVKVTRKESE